MLHEFLTNNRQELAQRCRTKVAERATPESSASDLAYGVPLFIGQLIDTLRAEAIAGPDAACAAAPTAIRDSAEKHGNELLLKGFTVAQVVHDYGDLCQALTELAREKDVPITVGEFQTFNRCLDDAMAGAVTEFGRQRDRFISEKATQAMNERLGCLAHEQRNLLNSAMLAFQAISNGSVGIQGATGSALGRTLIRLRDQIDRSLTDVRLTHRLDLHRELISIQELVAEVQVCAAMDAKARGHTYTALPIERGLLVEADRQMLISALVNLLENAFKFTRPNGHVTLSARAVTDHVVIDVEDECGGLAQGKPEKLFQPFEQAGGDRTGVGLGLSISRRVVEGNGGRLRVRNLPGVGCVFSIELPRLAQAASTQA